MKRNLETNKSEDIEKVKHFLLKLGFECNSFPSAQNLIYLKKNEVISIKNRDVLDK